MTSSGLLNPEEYHSASCKLGRSLELAAEYLGQLGTLLEQMRADDRRLRVEHAELLAGCKRLLASITVDGVITIDAGRETCQAIDAIVLAVAGTKGVLTGMARQTAEIDRLRAAIRKHRDQRMDDRCWLDDAVLYRELGEEVPSSYELKLPPKDEFLESCARYWEQRQPGASGVAARTGGTSCMTIAQLESEVARLKATLAKLQEPRPTSD